MIKKIVSVDGHMDLFYLPVDTFTSRAPAKLKDRVPRVEQIEGKPFWIGDGAVMGGHAAWMGRGQMTTHRGRRMAEAGWEPITQARCDDPPMCALDSQSHDLHVVVMAHGQLAGLRQSLLLQGKYRRCLAAAALSELENLRESDDQST